MPPLPLEPSAERLVYNLRHLPASPGGGPVYHVADIGAGFYFAYEQLRNMAEYREHHLLLRSAIERYLWRYVRLEELEPVAADLVIELTQAGYLKNDSVALATIEAIDDQLEQLADLALALTTEAAADEVTTWIKQYASVKIESLLNPDPRTGAFMQYAYEHYFTGIDRTATVGADVPAQQYRVALFCAIQNTIFKSDVATTRYHCLTTSLGPTLSPEQAKVIVHLNQQIDDLYQDRLTNRLSRLIGRYGAPMRILRELVFDGTAAANTLENRSATIGKVKLLCASEYERVHANLNQRIGKSILFVLITKTLIGLSIEVPYDLAVYGAVSFKPLLINILFPPLYMAALGSRVTTPSQQNTEMIANFADRMLYVGVSQPIIYRPRKRRLSSGLNFIFSTIYALGFLVSIMALVWILELLGFNLVNGIIFFMFFSAVSFLGLRLRRSAHELQLLDEHHGFLQAFLDFLSAPFVAIGHWLSDRYAKANIISLILDIAIEMPFKSFIRLARQWIRFLRDKQDEL
ncbi:MAG TPA: hypothetical protein VI322_03860 [Candidatus Saccharimonadia bacterium]